MGSSPTYYLHVGQPKTGTTFLQSLLREHRAALTADGVLYPSLGKYGRFLAALDGRDKRTYRGRSFDSEGKWARFVSVTSDFAGQVVFSHELMGAPRQAQQPTSLRELEGFDVHIIVTARDPGRQIPSCWQQSLRHGGTASLEEYVDAVVSSGRLAGQPLESLLANWAHHLPAQRIHLVTVPPVGSSPAELWRRFCTVIGADSTRYRVPAHVRSNTSLGVDQLELLRRVNVAAASRLDRDQHRKLVRRLYALNVLPTTPTSARPVLPRSMTHVAERMADNWISSISEHGYDVVGDLDDLRPRVPEFEPDSWDADRALSASAEATVDLLLASAGRSR
ncbi:hypothetical protein [Solicola gregarius]|uniref:Sulfotransferase domain-containing protein n=1 Tax=Solicola gregarius TaxID=2908642 RepID=A0AA46TKS3_9ACTN|nr:hypothetical protein [Solicola gregarius]UYM07101.1 hypothetical protein L0C25_08505 [Solicola gregarius]